MEPSCVGYYYPDHLPELGKTGQFPLCVVFQCVCVDNKLFHVTAGASVDEDEVIQSGDICSGDYVRVELDPEVFRAMHEGTEQAGWDDHMMEVCSLC